MLTVQDLLTLQTRPDVDEITLQIIAMFFEQHICGKTYIYTLKDSAYPLVRLDFKTSDLPHLLGIHKIKRQYQGDCGFTALREGHITFDDLERANSGKYAAILFRMLYFPFIYQLMHNPKFITIYPNQSGRIATLRFELYDRYADMFVHPRIYNKNNSTTDFFARTFGHARTDHRYRKRHIPVTSVTIID